MTDRQQHDQDYGQLTNLLLVLEHARADAWLRRDRRALEALLPPGFTGITPFGRCSRDDLLVRLFPRLVLHTVTIEDPALVLSGEGTAILTYQCFLEVSVDKKKKRGTFHAAAHYRWDGRQWKVLLWQVTPFCSS
jgi:hypothetical protein